MASEGAIGGNQSEFMALIEPILPAAYRLAAGMLQSSSEAEDAVQDGLLKAWQHFARFRRDSDIKPWLFTIVANECRHRRRSRWWSVGAMPNSLEDRAGEPALDVESAGLRRAVYRLPHEQRLALILRYYLDLSFEEVGRMLGVSTKAAKSRTYRALERLRMSPEVLPDE
jgi:RNA polymerase sigma-70 factor (ECF subfamily)